MGGVAHTDQQHHRRGGGSTRILVVTAATITGPELRNEIESHVDGSDTHVHVVAPALADSRFHHAMGDVDEPIDEASDRLEGSLAELRGAGLQATGFVGDSDPLIAIEDALQVFDADEILLLTHGAEDARWLEADAFERARHKFEPPITHIVVERAEGGARHVAGVEQAPPGAEPPPGREVEGRSGNVPPVSIRDLAGISVALVGTAILVVLAATCGETGHGAFDDFGCAARMLIAGAVLLINAAHVVGLVLFQSVGYRGPWERFFANFAIWGTPAAVVVSLLVA